MADIDQQAVFDRLPLTAEQRKKLYAAINEGPRKDSVTPVDSSEAPCSLVQLDRTPDHPTDCPVSQTH